MDARGDPEDSWPAEGEYDDADMMPLPEHLHNLPPDPIWAEIDTWTELRGLSEDLRHFREAHRRRHNGENS